jgi:hypothetical protein
MTKLAILSACLLAGGCMIDDEVGTGQVEQETGGCPAWACGQNSPEVDHHGFHELSLSGIPNSANFSLIKFVQGTQSYTLRVSAGKISAKHTSGTVLTGAALTGGYMVLQYGTAQYALRIAGVGTVSYWAAGATKKIETYQLDWSAIVGGGPNGKFTNVCTNPPLNNKDEAMGMNVYHSVVFEGDRIDAPTKTVSPTIDNDWFNIGCAGHVLAKLYLEGHVEAARGDGFTTDQHQRQTLLKMFSADYCGKGFPFTVSGQRLSWKDDLGWMSHLPGPMKVEARWNENGAVCLNTPRVDQNPTALSISEFGASVLDEMAANCAPGTIPPPCSDSDVNATDGMHLVTANPL